MENRRFSEVVREAIAGDPTAVETILARFMPMFNNQSKIDRVVDEDLRQYILIKMIMLIPKFKPDNR